MSTATTFNPRPSPATRFAVGVLLMLAISMGVFYTLMHPSLQEFGLMALFLSITTFISLLAGYSAYRLGWLDQTPSLHWSLLIGYILSSLLTFVNIWLTARLMFASPHDLLLATILLLYASGIAVVLGGFFSNALSGRIRRLEDTAREIAQGQLAARVEVRGRDELASLGQTFNQMAEQLQAAARKQQELERLRRDLIAWVSHDLQTPLTSMRAILEALADGVIEDPETVQRYLQTAQRDIRSLSFLIDDLFQMAQIDAGGLSLNLEAGSLSDLFSDTLETFSELAERRGLHLEGQVEADVDPVWMDTQRVGRVLANLVSNALRHTPGGGAVRASARRSPDGVLVEVSDTGEGIQPEDLPFVFDRFFRGEKSRSRATGGAGLGLAIARGIVEAHGGQITVESQPGLETVFRFWLPDRA